MDETRRVRIGERLDICLKGTPTAGFGWELHMPSDAASILEFRGDAWNVPKQTVGGLALQCFRFEAVAAGEAQLVFRYRRPWEETVRDERTVRVLIEPRE